MGYHDTTPDPRIDAGRDVGDQGDEFDPREDADLARSRRWRMVEDEPYPIHIEDRPALQFCKTCRDFYYGPCSTHSGYHPTQEV